jgi:hypothetical protein
VGLGLGGCGAASDHGGEASRPASVILADAAAALRGASSYHVSGMLDPGLAVDLVVTPGGVTGHLAARGVSWEEIEVKDQLWFRGAALWKATLDADRAVGLGDHWVLVNDPAAAFGFAGPLRKLETRMPGVVFRRRTAPGNRGTRQLGGRRVVELASDRDIYDVLADGTPYPVRWLETDNPGPSGQPCGITLDRFNAPAKVLPPGSALTLP